MIAIQIRIDGKVDYKIDLPRIHKAQEIATSLELKRSLRARGGNWWASAADSVESHSNTRGVLLTVSQLGVRLRWQGGRVPREGNTQAKLVSIPADKNNREYPRHYTARKMVLQPIAGKEKLRAILVEAEERPAMRGPRKGKPILAAKKNGDVIYWLCEWTNHEADETVIPVGDITSAAVDATKISLENQGLRLL